MVDNKSKTSLIRYNTHAMHLYNSVIFMCDIFFSVYVIWEVFLLYTSMCNVIKSHCSADKILSLYKL